MATISKTSPYELWEIDAVEGWLDDMASQGLLFEHTSGGMFIFRETQPQKVRHRLDIHGHIADAEARRESYRDFGWEHICYMDAKTDIYRAVDDDTVELHTDESVLQDAMMRTKRRMQWYFVISALLTALLLLLGIISINRQGFFYPLITNSVWDLLSLPLWFFVVIYGELRLWRSYRDFRRRSLLERSYHTREREAARRKEQRLDTGVRILIAALLLVNLIRPDPIALESFPLTGSDYERYEIQQLLSDDDRNSETEVFYQDHFLSRMCLFDLYTAEGERSYEVRIYECKGEWLARQYAKEAAQIAGASPVSGHQAWYYDGKPVYARHYKYQQEMQNLLLLEGDRVIHISYSGTQDLLSSAF